ncbi:MAG: hypothetical protein BWX45_01013 [Deltaproteobacteria bacterium ADurb.Bin002]|nr:MAG: hypothetical protein BWX45_01013 [Deltaproteobacteria bacterium ADurb.Bin002]
MGERKGKSRAFPAGERINHDPAGFAFDQRHVAEIKAAQLIDAVRNFEKSDPGIELRVTPQAWVDRRRRIALDKMKGGKVHQDRSVRRADLPMGLCDQAALGVLKVLVLAEVELLRHSLVCRYGRLAGVTGNPIVLPAAGEQEYCRQTQSRKPPSFRDPFHGFLLRFSACEKKQSGQDNILPCTLEGLNPVDAGNRTAGLLSNVFQFRRSQKRAGKQPC